MSSRPLSFSFSLGLIILRRQPCTDVEFLPPVPRSLTSPTVGHLRNNNANPKNNPVIFTSAAYSENVDVIKRAPTTDTNRRDGHREDLRKMDHVELYIELDVLDGKIDRRN